MKKFPALPKWPGMVVVGKKVTPDQAIEILVRTSGGVFDGNDKQTVSKLNAIFGIKTHDHEEMIESLKHIGIIRLEYLENGGRFTSCWVGGSYGWCDWNGNIFSNDRNIGKWPHVQEVLKEWEAISGAFPFLNLRCQLFDRETSEDGAVPLVEYEVEGGSVKVSAKPKPMDTPPVDCRLGMFDVSQARFHMEEIAAKVLELRERFKKC